MLSRARALCRVAAVATRASAPVGAHAHVFSPGRHHSLRCFSATASSSLSWGALAADLSSPPGSEDPAAAAASVAKADLRVDEWHHPSGVATFWLLRHADTDPAGAASFDPGADLGSGANADVLASIVQQDSILYGMKTRRPLPPSVAARLVRAAAETAAEAPEDKKLTALVALPRLCAWARAGERWNDAEVLSKSNGEACEAAEAIALGRPREGHSVLGRGTFAAAEPAWVALAEAHMEEDADVLGELMAYKSVLPGAFRAAHMADGDPEYLAVAGGAMAVLTPP
mmetsp:Transcript_4129/g.16390  ORF Transcript_4129/g.16390 Transcript_4129/m.16390 type:complete len:286 (-) Transcript_4129:101-958(-)